MKCKYFLQKVQLAQKSKVFDGFYRYMTYRKYFAEKKAQTELLSKLNLKAKALKSLKIYKVQMAFFDQTSELII